jgi:hypothetical protein
MAFMTSRAEPGTQKVSPNHQEDKNSTTNSKQVLLETVLVVQILVSNPGQRSSPTTHSPPQVHKQNQKCFWFWRSLRVLSFSPRTEVATTWWFFFLHLKFKQATSKHSFHIWAIYAYMEIALLLNGFWCYFSIYIFNLYDNSKIGICIITHQADQWLKIHSI